MNGKELAFVNESTTALGGICINLSEITFVKGKTKTSHLTFPVCCVGVVVTKYSTYMQFVFAKCGSSVQAYSAGGTNTQTGQYVYQSVEVNMHQDGFGITIDFIDANYGATNASALITIIPIVSKITTADLA